MKFDEESLAIQIDKGKIDRAQPGHKKPFKFGLAFMGAAQKLGIAVKCTASPSAPTRSDSVGAHRHLLSTEFGCSEIHRLEF